MEVSITCADQRGSAPELLWQSRRRNTPLARHRRHLRIMRELARDLNLARPTEAERNRSIHRWRRLPALGLNEIGKRTWPSRAVLDRAVFASRVGKPRQCQFQPYRIPC
jgi:hypothetical protein